MKKLFALVLTAVLLCSGLGAAASTELVAGQCVTFGTYPQTADGSDKTPIEWLVLEVQGSKALLVSRYGLDTKPYNTQRTDITWEKSTLRAWLNTDFISKAFTAAEQGAILATAVDNSESQGYSDWSTNGGDETQDRIFLLSYAEANMYFGVTYDDDQNTRSRVEPTAYALKQGAYTSGSNETADGKAAGRWLLRSPGCSQRYAAIVYSYGSLSNSIVDNTSAVVRPAFWINLESDIF